MTRDRQQLPVPMPLKIYLWLSRFAMGFARWHLTRRQKHGKEDAARIPERLGEAIVARPQGRVVWFHAASVGESLAILELIRRLIAAQPGISCLVTTGTRTAADLLKKRLPQGAIHQFVPIDAMRAVTGFLDHWRPDLAVWTESELWPALIWATSQRQIPMLILNARISASSYRGWRRIPATAKSLLSKFSHVYAQDEETSRRFLALGYPATQLQVTGSLKEGSISLPHDENELAKLRACVAGRPLWCAASTHPGEEEVVISALKEAKKQFPGLLTIIIPRHANRSDEVATLIRGAGLRMRCRSKGEYPAENTDVYLADTMGEMGLWYRLSPLSFVGGSLADIGGHNPFEPAGLGSAILFGPHVENFADIYQRLMQAGGARLVEDANGLGAAVCACLQSDAAAQMATAAWGVCSEGTEITDRALALLESVLAQKASA